MRKEGVFLRIGGVLLAALAGWAAWYGEIVWVKGWAGLAWLEGYPRAAFTGVLCVAVAMLIAAPGKPRATAGRRALFVVVTSAIALLCFELARRALYDLYSRSAAFMALAGEEELAFEFMLTQVACLLGANLLAAVGLTITVHFFLVRARWWLGLLYLAALALVMPLGMLTFAVLPAGGHGHFVDVVKAGYPVFWTVVLLALATWAGTRARGPARDHGAEG